jgi:TRAP-type mannitol/chloroaromatic compound transport system permease large subunit
VSFVLLVALSTPIVFALGLSGLLGLYLGNFSLQKMPSALVAGSQSWVLLAVPTFVFAGALMERCGMSYALVNLARGLVGGARRVLLLRHLGLHDRRRLGHRLDADAADAACGL